MQEEQTAPEKLIVIDIKLSRGLVLALSCLLVLAALLAFLTLTGGSASASETEAAGAALIGMRQYYVTEETITGAGARDACAPGYHMASFWEIADPSNLQYNTTLGAFRDDSGHGPTVDSGWVRTGYYASTSNTVGRANCDGYTSATSGEYGTAASLPNSWETHPGFVGVWRAHTVPCDGSVRVWCMED